MNEVKTIIANVMTWLKLGIGLVLAVLLATTLIGFLGHQIPYVPAFKGSLQDIDVFTAALAYWLK